jgi:ubiquinone/menaquinone biosynthesis C-methylase UbiE
MTQARSNTVRDFEHAGWEAAASQYERLFAGATKHYVGALLEGTHTSAHTHLLDVACGPGFAAANAREIGATAVGIDFSAAMIAVARSRYADINFIEADATALPFERRSFDAVISNFGVHHFENPARAFEEFNRVLKPFGHLAFTIWAKPHENPAWRLIMDAISASGTFDVPMPAGNDNRNSLDNFIELTQSAGFFDVRAEQLEMPWRMPVDTDLVTLFERSTVRMSSLIRGQRPEALLAIRRHVAQSVETYLKDGAIELGTKAYIVLASKHQS